MLVAASSDVLELVLLLHPGQVVDLVVLGKAPFFHLEFVLDHRSVPALDLLQVVLQVVVDYLYIELEFHLLDSSD